jgi:hypothetical protein
MLDLLRDSNPDDVTRILRARGEGTLGGILYAQEYAAEALSLQESARNTFLDLRSRKCGDQSPADAIELSEQRVVDAMVHAGDLDGSECLHGNGTTAGTCDERQSVSDVG